MVNLDKPILPKDISVFLVRAIIPAPMGLKNVPNDPPRIFLRDFSRRGLKIVHRDGLTEVFVRSARET